MKLLSGWRWFRSHCLPATKYDLEQLKLELLLMANTLDDVLADVQAESTVDDSIITLVQGLKTQLDQVLAGGLTTAQQTKVDAIFNAIEANKTKVTAAVTANTPAATTTTPPASTP